jgi:hypothetical protein
MSYSHFVSYLLDAARDNHANIRQVETLRDWDAERKLGMAARDDDAAVEGIDQSEDGASGAVALANPDIGPPRELVCGGGNILPSGTADGDDGHAGEDDLLGEANVKEHAPDLCAHVLEARLAQVVVVGARRCAANRMSERGGQERREGGRGRGRGRERGR